MKLNFALLRANTDKAPGTLGTVGTPTVSARSAVPKVSPGTVALGDSQPAPSEVVPRVPARPSDLGTLEARNGAASPVSPVSPAKSEGLATTGPEAANDPAPGSRFVLTYEVDGRQATCLDPTSASLEAAVADLARLYGPRLGRVWCKGALVRDMPRH